MPVCLKVRLGFFWLVFRFLYKQLLLFFDPGPEAKENCIFESSANSHQLQLKSKTSLHLYTSHSPEGAAKNFYFKYSCSPFFRFVDMLCASFCEESV